MNRITRFIRAVRQNGPRAGVQLVQDRLSKNQRETDLRRWLEKYAQQLPSESILFPAMGLPVPKTHQEMVSALAKLDENLRLRFMPSLALPDIAHQVQTLYPSAKTATVARAEHILAGGFSWLIPGYPDFAPHPRWFIRLPTTDTVTDWPLRPIWHLAEIDDQSPADIRITWELGRHQFLSTLGRAWALTHDARFAMGAVQILLDWIKENPFAMGIHWLHAQEVSLRLKSWLWTWGLIHNCPQITVEQRLVFYQSLWQHAEYITKTRSRSRITHNHMLTEWAGIAHFSLTFPKSRIALEWTTESIHRFEQELIKQFWEDGAPGEGSVGYHLFVLETTLELGAQCRHLRHAVDDRAQVRVRAMLEFAADMFRPDGSFPRIGDVDDGRGFRLSDQGLGQDRRGILHVGAQLLRTGALNSDNSGDYEEEFWLLGEGVAKLRRRKDPPKPRRTARLYERSGIAVAQFPGLGAQTTSHLVFCGGPEAIRSGVSAAHHHADSLQVIWWRHGFPVLIDPGTSYYGGPLERRCALRRTAAHNAPTLDGLDRFDVTSQRFGVGRIPLSKMVDWEPGKDWCCVGFRVVASTHLPDSPRLERHVFVRGQGDYIVVIDKYLADDTAKKSARDTYSDRHFAQHFHFAPAKITKRINNSSATVTLDLNWHSAAPPLMLEIGAADDAISVQITPVEPKTTGETQHEGRYGVESPRTTVDVRWLNPALPKLVWSYLGPPLESPVTLETTGNHQVLTIRSPEWLDTVELTCGVPKNVTRRQP